jgi:hypothetical protein
MYAACRFRKRSPGKLASLYSAFTIWQFIENPGNCVKRIQHVRRCRDQALKGIGLFQAVSATTVYFTNRYWMTIDHVIN